MKKINPIILIGLILIVFLIVNEYTKERVLEVNLDTFDTNKSNSITITEGTRIEWTNQGERLPNYYIQFDKEGGFISLGKGGILSIPYNKSGSFTFWWGTSENNLKEENVTVTSRWTI